MRLATKSQLYGLSHLEHSQQLLLPRSALLLKHAVVRQRPREIQPNLLHGLVVGHQQKLAVVAIALRSALRRWSVRPFFPRFRILSKLLHSHLSRAPGRIENQGCPHLGAHSVRNSLVDQRLHFRTRRRRKRLEHSLPLVALEKGGMVRTLKGSRSARQNVSLCSAARLAA
jgi:hypothetical protein